MLINYNYLKITTDNLIAIEDSLIHFLLENKYSYRLFNTSMIQIDKYNYLCLIRILYDGYKGDYDNDA